MPLARKLLIFAAVDGLVLQPRSPPHAQHQQAIKIDYKGNIGPLLRNNDIDDITASSFESHGVLGLLKVATSVFLISICGREQVAQVRGKPIYKITDVTLIPLASQSEADKAITSTRERLHRHSKTRGVGEDDTDSESEDDAPSVTDSLVEDTPHSPIEVKDPITGQRGPADKRSSVAEDVMQKKGVYGRFANKWFSRTGWSADSRRTQGLSSEEDLAAKNVPKNVDSTGPTEEADPSQSHELPSDERTTPDTVKPEDIPKALEGDKDATTIALLPRVLQTTKMYFSSGNFFYSYDYDLSHGIADQSVNTNVPLFKQYDPLFFWNQHIIAPFIEAGQHSFVLPVIQGFVGQRPFTIKIADGKSDSLVIDSDATPDDIQLQSWHEEGAAPSESSKEDMAADLAEGKDFLLTLISRRSIKRAGLRYLRRGTDDEGCTANTVETEQMLSVPTWNTSQDKIYSFTQLRGSIPLYFSQSPYSLKPQVSTWGSFETNGQAFRRHFHDLAARYSEVYVASLIDKHGTEAKIGELYEQHAKNLNEHGGIDGKGKRLGFEWFDFHNVCRGMHFENVSKLMDSLAPYLDSTGWTEISDDSIAHKQSGILRTNCMDCLDRTNVVQSATARGALEQQLSVGNYTIDLQNDPSTSWFNTLWADNGDNISRQYAGTAALKGDFTRTRKRQITGALTDFGLTLTRYYNNIVNDYFAQAVIDYLLGRATDTIFAEFEADMKSSDYFVDVRKVRQAAIERCAARVIEDEDEDLLHGWTLSVPTSANHVKTSTFEEAVLLLTGKALYFCRLDWGTEKVSEFEHIALENVQGLIRGVYITSTLAQRHTDAEKNVGFVIRFRADAESELIRRNTRALDSGAANDEQKRDEKKTKSEEGRFLAFKALPPRSSVPSEGEKVENEVDVVREICEEVVRVANKAKKVAPGPETDSSASEGRVLQIEEKDIISLADAKKSTGYLEQIGYSLKKLVW
ncbi:SacI homology domain-containing protein [Boeremia exigua]|uniref:SacI homology domain-containing protein n=1 Tax=Boeremia exigua TaxID=749465 RepID=UPI001E8EF0D0|nr:SacI homology domain-containing protein [Boeremia exigua]KAH6644755.1 SacI homology domain-containing protein [Boeremia exigua]